MLIWQLFNNPAMEQLKLKTAALGIHLDALADNEIPPRVLVWRRVFVIWYSLDSGEVVMFKWVYIVIDWDMDVKFLNKEEFIIDKLTTDGTWVKYERSKTVKT